MLNERFLEDLINLIDINLEGILYSIDINAQYLFKTLTKLKTIRFRHNRLRAIKKNYFDYLTNLEELVLRCNQIETIELGSFKNLKNLKRLDLSNNFVEKFQNDSYPTDCSISFEQYSI